MQQPGHIGAMSQEHQRAPGDPWLDLRRHPIGCPGDSLHASKTHGPDQIRPPETLKVPVETIQHPQGCVSEGKRHLLGFADISVEAVHLLEQQKASLNIAKGQ